MCSVVNLDPAAEEFQYEPSVDVRELVQLEDAMEADDLNYGPNGGLIFCMEYLTQHDGMEWLKVRWSTSPSTMAWSGSR